MSDFILAIANHLDREPSLCGCGHPSILHLPDWGCTARWEHDSGSDPCSCVQTDRGIDTLGCDMHEAR